MKVLLILWHATYENIQYKGKVVEAVLVEGMQK